MMSYLYLPAMRSAAFKKTAARSENGSPSHDCFAARAASMAAETSALDALEYDAIVVAWEEGSDCVSTEESLI